MDLGRYNTQTDPKKEEVEGSVSERFVDNGSLWQGVQSRQGLYLCPRKGLVFAPFGSLPCCSPIGHLLFSPYSRILDLQLSLLFASILK